MYQLKILLQLLHHTLPREHQVEESYEKLLKYQYLYFPLFSKATGGASSSLPEPINPAQCQPVLSSTSRLLTSMGSGSLWLANDTKSLSLGSTAPCPESLQPQERTLGRHANRGNRQQHKCAANCNDFALDLGL